MIFIGLGANLKSAEYGSPTATLEAALGVLSTTNCSVIRRSAWYRSSPVPASSQPWYYNGVAELDCDLSPDNLLLYLHTIEDKFGRVRSAVNAPRIIDLDLLVYDNQVLRSDSGPIVPHPRMQDRAFVLLPLRDLVADWVDPRNGRPIQELIDDLPADQVCVLADQA